jgi:formate hydrogenlyase subunit 3/multisubunit Na+/H+ antiporter MnhD subunit
MNVLFLALALLVGGGGLALFASRYARIASAMGASSAVGGCFIGIGFAIEVLRGDNPGDFSSGWDVPGGAIHIAADPLSAFFLVPVFALSGLAAVYGHSYLLAYRANKRLGVPWFSFNLLVAAMAVVTVARQAVLFLVAWEVMSLAAYVLVTFEHEDREVTRAGWVYLIATHIGTACLVALFLLLGRAASSFDFDRIATMGRGAAPYGLILGLAIVGFGTKAGFVPLHVWLPEAHAAAPSHVSAVMSGVLIKMGLYGLVRTILLLGPPAPWVGASLALIGFVSASVGIVLSLYQRDMKRVLAYSSIENVGIVTIGLGLGFWGRASGFESVAALGMGGALFHVWNHTLMKGLMFLGAGSVLHGCGSKDLEKLGGVLKRMPRTGTLLIFGAAALAALPPLNGFASEWLVYLGLIEAGQTTDRTAAVGALLGVGALAIVGALAVLSFVRLVGVSLLGQARSSSAEHAHESPFAMTAPMGALALGCLAVGIAPGQVVHAIWQAAAEALAGGLEARPPGVPLATLGNVDGGIWVALVATTLLVLIGVRGRKTAFGPTWGCGYAASTSRVQYTARSFSELAAEKLVPRFLRPRLAVSVAPDLFPPAGSLSSDSADPLTRSVYEPLLAGIADRLSRLRWVQQGVLHVYILYIAVAVLIAFGWATLRNWSGP